MSIKDINELNIHNIKEALATLEAKLLAGEDGTIEISLRRIENAAKRIRETNSEKI